MFDRMAGERVLGLPPGEVVNTVLYAIGVDDSHAHEYIGCIL